ncbi:outer membrane protein OmpA-like peptidoglycan-associated protein [Pontibacter ummariensis]|uniref:Outer membrane protein OmpA n=1 Tax=Pontibacter ummariensis TaxID=1610492 RepID=A0A239F7C4_9BACT|nr:OmpA family protein [Pontibacter ummariensis]PRY12394.1 outer membrane protein OmpA-like peptidoglycan-associated protein [Pontibacter ummariensis]SNS52725.1 Outer membrane protein OmpA [Pontibacter ummariensis]
MYKPLLAAILLTLSAASVSLAQNQKLSTTSSKAVRLYEKADEYTRARDFNRALGFLNQAIEKDPGFVEAYIRAANLHKMMGNKQAVFEYLQRGLGQTPYNPSYANYYFDLADLYFERGAYQEAKQNFEAFLKAKPRNPKLVQWAKDQIRSADFALAAMQKPVPFNPEQLPQTINRFGLQYFPYTTADQRFFIYTARASNRPEHDENIFVSAWKDGEWQAPAPISETINSPANEGAATISGDGKTLVFTSCNRSDGVGDCDLYISFRTGNEWSKPKNMGSPVNAKAWDSQPSLSADGRTLYFTSTRSGGVGKEDIWVTYLNEDGSWQQPLNLGDKVNSPGKDMAPSIHVSGSTLYFVSDGHVGLGGLDVFKATRGDNNQWSEPQNLGYPLNTHADEGSLFITPDNEVGYYSRQGTTDAGAVTIQLYRFDVPQAWRSSVNSTYAQGRVFDAATKKPLAAQVQLYNVATDSLVQQVNSDKVTGEYTVVLTEGKQYALYVSAPQYLMNSVSFDYTSPKSLSPVALDVYLEPIVPGAAVTLNNLFFDTGKYELEKESKTELNKLVKFLEQNPKVKIEIAGHTDDVGSDKANQVLSEKRARAVVEYLASNGVAKDRFRYKGYGESKPVKPNTSDENRQQNRRIEMRVL